MTAPSATSASYFPLCARACSASGVSRAPGTETRVMLSSATLSRISSSVQALSSPSPTSMLKRLITMPMRKPLPSRFFSNSFMWVPCMQIVVWIVRGAAACSGPVLDIADHFQVEPGHARHLAWHGQQTHFRHIEVPENLRADAVVAQVQFGGDPGGGLAGLDALSQSSR